MILKKKSKKNNSFEILKKLFFKLSKRRKLQLYALLLLMLISALAEVISLGSVIPFILILTNPEKIWDIEIIRYFANFFEITNPEELVFPITLLFSIAALVSSFVRLFTLWFNTSLANSIGSDLSCEAYFKSLNQPYIYHIKNNTSKTITAILTQINRTIMVINSVLQLITASLILFALLTTLFLIDKNVASFSLFTFGTIYSGIIYINKGRLNRNGKFISRKSQELVKYLQEGLGGIQVVLLDNVQLNYLSGYKLNDTSMRKKIAQSQFIAQFPRQIMEGFGIVIISLVALLLLRKSEDNQVLFLETLGALVLASQRILPALQQVYSSWATIKTYISSVEDVLKTVNLPLKKLQESNIQKLLLKKDIKISNLSFEYTLDNTKKRVFENLNINLSINKKIGLIGETGSGKSTFINLLVGLLEPQRGDILLNDKSLFKSDPKLLKEWQSSISYVPQSIFLTDTTIKENIAFGIDPKKIDIDKVKWAAKKARISDYIEDLPFNYDAKIGERGIQLSGGQKQRLGIARAFYKNSAILILDEATSALDNNTEKEVMASINSAENFQIILMIAHRISTLKSCDMIYKIQKGQLIKVNLD